MEFALGRLVKVKVLRERLESSVHLTGNKVTEETTLK